MLVRLLFAVGTLSISICGQVQAQNLCQIIAGTTIVARDGSFLGNLTNSNSTDSIFNEYGMYGGKYGVNSIWNQYGIYGSQYSNQSPFSQYTLTPPFLVKEGKVIAVVTVNKNIRGALNPYIIKSCEL
jgi:hypothetical protein